MKEGLSGGGPALLILSQTHASSQAPLLRGASQLRIFPSAPSRRHLPKPTPLPASSALRSPSFAQSPTCASLSLPQKAHRRVRQPTPAPPPIRSPSGSGAPSDTSSPDHRASHTPLS